MTKFKVEKAEEGTYCDSYVRCCSRANRNWIRMWLCGESAAYTIRFNRESWGLRTYCKLHAHPFIDQLLDELLAKPEEEEKAAS